MWLGKTFRKFVSDFLKQFECLNLFQKHLSCILQWINLTLETNEAIKSKQVHYVHSENESNFPVGSEWAKILPLSQWPSCWANLPRSTEQSRHTGKKKIYDSCYFRACSKWHLLQVGTSVNSAKCKLTVSPECAWVKNLSTVTKRLSVQWFSARETR